MSAHGHSLIPLSRLRVSPFNVRKTAATGIDELAHSIDTKSLLQNLVVHKLAAKGSKELFGVACGGRRLAAMQLLLKHGKLKPSSPIECKIVSDAEAVAASLAENTDRLEMHPADEYEGFKALVDSGQSIEDVAALFHVTPLIVRRRLKLANVAPALIECYREGKMDLECLMAFAGVDDHERQLAVFKGLSRRPHAYDIRNALALAELPTKHGLVKFIGVKAYRKAGGALREDLFSEPRAEYATDVELVRQLALAKLTEAGEQLKDEEGAAWFEARLTMDFAERKEFAEVPMVRRKPTAKQAARLKTLQAKLQALDVSDDDESWEAEDQLSSEVDGIEASLRKPDPRAAAIAGIVVTVNDGGKIEVLRGQVRAEDRKFLKQVTKAVAGESEADGNSEDASADLSNALRVNLSTHYTAALQSRLQAAPLIALRTLAVALWNAVSMDYRRTDDPVVRVRGDAPDHRNADNFEGTEAARSLGEDRTKWQAQLGDLPDLFQWLTTQSDELVLTLLAHCTASFADATGARLSDAARSVARAVDLRMEDYWTPTSTAFLKRVPRAVILDALREVNPSLDFDALGKVKKAELIATAEPVLLAARWLPPMLRPATA